MSDAATPELSVIVVVGDLRERARHCLRSLLDQGMGERLEVLVVDCSGPATGAVPLAAEPAVRVVPGPLDFAVARAGAIAVARAPVVAFLEEHCRVLPGWAEALLAAFRETGAAGVGGAVVPQDFGPSTSRVVGLLSYGAWMEQSVRAGDTDLLPGHNASYRTAVLRELGDELPLLLRCDVVLQRRLRARGHRLVMAPAARFVHLNEASFRAIANGLFLWYRSYGPLRAAEGAWGWPRRLGYVAAVPIIPLYFLLLLRRRLRGLDPELRRAVRRHLPAIYLAQLAGAAGQALGLLLGPGKAMTRFSDYELHQPRVAPPTETRDRAA